MGKLHFLFFLFFTTLGACKKDLLHVRNVQKLNSYADNDRLNQILFVNDSVGFVVGGQRFNEAVILRTKDGGTTWEKKILPAAGKGLYGITQSPSGVLYVCGFDGKILRSYDMGDTWAFTQIDYFAFTGIAFADAVHAITVGGVSFNSGIREYIDSSGHNMHRDSLAYQLNKITMVSATEGYICGYGAMLKTVDGGKTWNFQNVKDDNFNAMDIHGDEIWMCGYNGGVYHTYDGGNHWTELRNGNNINLPRYRLLDIAFKDERNGWAAGESGKMIYTDDGGQHWEEYDQFTTEALRSISIRPDGSLLVAGDNGALYKITPR
jgi:photosystem II stability/assembly factor-like uncharacterized protein